MRPAAQRSDSRARRSARRSRLRARHDEEQAPDSSGVFPTAFLKVERQRTRRRDPARLTMPKRLSRPRARTSGCERGRVAIIRLRQPAGETRRTRQPSRSCRRRCGADRPQRLPNGESRRIPNQQREAQAQVNTLTYRSRPPCGRSSGSARFNAMFVNQPERHVDSRTATARRARPRARGRPASATAARARCPDDQRVRVRARVPVAARKDPRSSARDCHDGRRAQARARVPRAAAAGPPRRGRTAASRDEGNDPAPVTRAKGRAVRERGRNGSTVRGGRQAGKPIDDPRSTPPADACRSRAMLGAPCWHQPSRTAIVTATASAMSATPAARQRQPVRLLGNDARFRRIKRETTLLGVIRNCVKWAGDDLDEGLWLRRRRLNARTSPASRTPAPADGASSGSILPHREDVDADRARIVHRPARSRLPSPRGPESDESGLGTRRDFFACGEDEQRLARSSRGGRAPLLQPLDRPPSCARDFGPRLQDDVERGEIAGKSTGQAFDLRLGGPARGSKMRHGCYAKIASDAGDVRRDRSRSGHAVSTKYFQPISATAAATRLGSSQSTSPRGDPVFTLQKWQPRVHVSPRIMIVAVPAPQHSPMFGHIASWHSRMQIEPAHPRPGDVRRRRRRGVGLFEPRRFPFGGSPIRSIVFMRVERGGFGGNGSGAPGAIASRANSSENAPSRQSSSTSRTSAGATARPSCARSR